MQNFMLALLSTVSTLTGNGCLLQHVNFQANSSDPPCLYIQLSQLRFSPSKAEYSNTSAKGFLGIAKKLRSDSRVAFFCFARRYNVSLLFIVRPFAASRYHSLSLSMSWN